MAVAYIGLNVLFSVIVALLLKGGTKSFWFVLLFSIILTPLVVGVLGLFLRRNKR
jgi:hypothetical protein